MKVLNKIKKLPTAYIIGIIIVSAMIVYFTMTNIQARSDQLTPQKRFFGSFFQGITSIITTAIWAIVIVIIVLAFMTVYFTKK